MLLKKFIIHCFSFFIIIGFSLIFFSAEAGATVYESVAPQDMVLSGQTIKTSSSDTPVIKFQLTGSTSTDAISQVSIILSAYSTSTASTSDFNEVKIYKSSDQNLDSGDSVIGVTSTINVSTTTDISVSDTIAATSSWYIATVSASSSAVLGRQFTVSMPVNAIVSNGGSVTSTVATSTNLTIASAQAPILTSFSSTTVNVGDSITIAGANFSAATGTILFLDGPLGDRLGTVSSWSWNSIGVTIPLYAQTGIIRVVADSVTTTISGLTVKPKVVSASASTNSVTVSFDNYMDGIYAADISNYTLISGGSSVDLSSAWMDFRGNQATIRNISLTAGNSFQITAGSAVKSLAGTSIDSGYNNISGTVVNAPAIASVSPSSGSMGDIITITGTGFGSTQGQSKIYFSPGPPTGGAPQPPIEATIFSWSATSIQVAVPSAAKAGPIFLVVNGIESDFNSNAFFDIKTNYQLEIKNASSANIGNASTSRIVIGNMSGPTLYYVGDSASTAYNATTGVFSIPNISSSGFVWVFDTSGDYVTGSGTELNASGTQVFNLATSTRKISGSITGAGANRTIVVWADPVKESGTDMEWTEPIFLQTNASGTVAFNIGIDVAGKYMIGTEDPGFKTQNTSNPKIAPSPQEADVTASNVSGLAFEFAAAAARIHGKIEKAEGKSFLDGPGTDAFHVFAYEPKENGFHASAVPDSNGEFDLYVNPVISGDSGVHTYIIEVGGPGIPFMTQETIEVNNTNSDFALSNSVTDITLKIRAPEDFIEGTVKDSQGNGISGASIFAWSENGPGGGEAFTDSSGYYKLYLSSGSYAIEGFAPNFGQLSRRTGIAVSSSEHPTVDFSVTSEMATISGTVTKGGSNSSGVEVWITEGEFGLGINGNKTDSSGAYTLRVPYTPSGTTYWIHAAQPGIGELYKGAISTTLDKDNTSLTENIAINTIAITVKISPKSAFNNAFVGIHGTGSTNGGGFSENDISSTSSAFRQYSIEVPKPSSGNYTYTVEGGIPNYGPLPANMTVDTVLQNNHDITISSGTSAMTIEFTLGDVYTISGTISDPNLNTTSTNEAAGAWIWAASPSGFGGGEVGSDGSFSFNITSGTYDIGIDKPGYIGSTINGADVTSGNYAVSSGALVLTTASNTITGTVSGSGLLSGAWIWAVNGDGGWAGAQTNGDGEFTLNVGTGDWTIKAIAEGYSESSSLTVSAGASGVVITLTAVSGYTAAVPKVEPITPNEGGIIQGDNVRVEAAAGALGTGTQSGWLTINETNNLPTTNSFKPLANKGKSITAQDSSNTRITTLSSSITIEITYTAADLVTAGMSQADALNLSLGYWNSLSNTWVSIPTTAVADSAGTGVTYTGTTDHLSDFAPLIPSGSNPPSTPAGLAIAAGDGQITLSWTASAGATKYYIYRKSGSNYPYLAQTNGVSYNNTGLTNGTTYYYKVSALNSDDDESSATAAVSAAPVAASSGGSVVPLWILQQPTEETPEQPVEEKVTVSEKKIGEMTIEEIKTKIAETLDLIANLRVQLAGLVGGTAISGIPSDFTFENNLRYGTSHEDIKYLQIVLNSNPDTQLAVSGVGSSGSETIYFGDLTKAAVVKFQEKYAEDVLAPWGFAKGTGFVGSTTRAKINEILGR